MKNDVCLVVFLVTLRCSLGKAYIRNRLYGKLEYVTAMSTKPYRRCKIF